MAYNVNVVSLASPPIPQAKAWCDAYRGDQGPIIDLSQAVPGYPPAEALLTRLGAAAASADYAGYGPILGEDVLRSVYARHVREVYGAGPVAEEVAITAGCNEAFVVAMIGLAAAGDAVVLAQPWYFNHAMTLAMLGIEARPLPCRAQAGFIPDPADAASVLDERVKAIVLVTPNNPTGATYPPAVLSAFYALCRRRGIALVVDETYRDYLAGDTVPHRLFDEPDWRETLIQLYSFSKAYCIPGHRLGALVAGETFIGEIAKILDNVQICPPRAGQAALSWAIDGLRHWRARNSVEMAQRAAAMRRVFADLPAWQLDSIGAYFAYVRHPFEGVAAESLAAALAAERGVLVLPGSYFGEGQETHLRVAFANVATDVVGSLAARLRDFRPPRPDVSKGGLL
jgi:aspartate/methionine/tyrosine aminotransferase